MENKKIEFKSKTKNNNKANETFAANHVEYLSESQLKFTGEESDLAKMVRNNLEREKEYWQQWENSFTVYTKLFGYKTPATENVKCRLWMKLNKPFILPENTSYFINLRTSTHDIIEGVFELADQYENEITITSEQDIDLKKLYFVELVIGYSSKKELDVEAQKLYEEIRGENINKMSIPSSY